MIELACFRIICACYIMWDGVNYRIVGANWDIGTEVSILDFRWQRNYFCYGFELSLVLDARDLDR